MRSLPLVICLLAFAASTASAPAAPDPTEEGLTLSWADNMLTVRGRHLPGGAVKVWYLEAFCRPGSTDRDWKRDRDPARDQAGRGRPGRPPDPPPQHPGRWGDRRARHPGRPRRGRLPPDRHQPDGPGLAGPLGPALRARRRLHRGQADAELGGVPAEMLRLRRRQADADADAALGDEGAGTRRARCGARPTSTGPTSTPGP